MLVTHGKVQCYFLYPFCLGHKIHFLCDSFHQNPSFLEVRNTSKKSEKIRGKSRKLDEDAMLCNTLRPDVGSSQKQFLPFRVLLNVGIDPNFPQKLVFYLYWLHSKRNFAFWQNFF